MRCTHVKVGGTTMIVCGGRGRGQTVPCASCGKPSTLLCDWWEFRRTLLCDQPICASCTTSPAPGKDLCPTHARRYRAWLAGRTNSNDGAGP